MKQPKRLPFIVLIAASTAFVGVVGARGNVTATKPLRAGAVTSVSNPTPGPVAGTANVAPVCSDSIQDQNGPGCLQASSVPALGMLFPPVHDGGELNDMSGTHSFIGGGRANTASGTYATVVGGNLNTVTALNSSIGGGFSNSVGAGSATIGGGGANTILPAAGTATIAGGGFNTATATLASIGGGTGNSAGALATVSGGSNNTASGSYATVAGGRYNTASGLYANASGGSFCYATGASSSTAGGQLNTAAGSYSFAAGRRSKANHSGAFVWGDSFNADKNSSANDQFNVYASGGARIFSNTAATTGVLLAAGGGTWTSVSDREAKENFKVVDGIEILDRLAEIPITTWNYKSQDPAVRHMGPMAQDFYEAFGLGLGERTIDQIDPDGVALAAIQALNAKVRERDGELIRLRTQVTELLERLDSIPR